MYVYKKKCDEDYYLSIIRSTQQQFMFQNQPNPYCFQYQKPNFYNYSHPGPISYNNAYRNNYNNNYDIYRTPDNRNYTQRFNNSYNNNQYNGNQMSPSPLIGRKESQYGYHDNGNRKHIMEDQLLSNKLKSINNINNSQDSYHFQKKKNYTENEPNNRFNINIYQELNNNNYINKKVIKLEDFLSGTKRNNLNDKFNRIANENMD